MAYGYKFTRDDCENTIRMLVSEYPKTFFEDPELRRPLKKNIEADIQKDGFGASFELIQAGVDFYRSHFGYRRNLLTGAKRIDITGKEGVSVTAAEYAMARKKLHEDKQRLAENNLMNATKTVAALHHKGRIPDDQLKKLDAPPLPRATPTVVVKQSTSIVPELARLHDAFMAANAMLASSSNIELRNAMTSAALGVVIKEAQRVIDASKETAP
jgi:sRNA-binding protein